DPEARRYLELALEPDYRVVTVAHGREMREQFGVHGQQIAAVLMDLSLKETEDGLALTRWIRTQPALRQIPVIATTALASSDIKLKALAGGLNAYLIKPFKRDE